jgi:endonuclease/exonuclease/phosphatase family metal-dependent hydrolase
MARRTGLKWDDAVRMGHDSLSVLTYNVRHCAGMDGEISPLRVADVIAQYSPDIVALQELDIRRARSGHIDQPQVIARHLNMDFHFTPAFTIQEEEYGNAVLSRLPMSLVKAGPLPTLPGRKDLEARSAIWVKVRQAGGAGADINIVSTHMGLKWRERRAQADAILGPDWLSNPACETPIILCGDFNAGPLSLSCRRFRVMLHDAQRASRGRPKSTWPSFFPISRIDHIFVSADFKVEGVEVPQNSLSRSASDHLPLLVKLRLKSSCE